MSLKFEPPLSFAASVALVLALFGLTVALSVRGWRVGTNRAVIGLRLLTFGLLAMLFLNPVRISQTVRRDKPVFAVLLDASRSMNTADADGQTRWQSAKFAVTGDILLLESLQSRFDVRFFTFGKQAQNRTPEMLRAQSQADQAETRIADALTFVSSLGQFGASRGSVPVLGGMLLISDGRDTGTADPLQAARQCRARGLPVFTLTLGKTQEEPDCALSAPKPQIFAAPNQSFTLPAELRNTGIGVQNATLTLTREGQTVQTKTIRLQRGRQKVEWVVREPAKGVFRYQIRLEPLSKESDVRNNSASVLLSILDAKTRVLLLEAEPSWDAKFTAQALRADPTIELDAIYLLMDQRPIAQSGSADAAQIKVPRSQSEFARYDVLIIGKGYEQFFDPTATANLKAWLSERGGSLVLLRGRPDERTPALRELEPLTMGSEVLEATRAELTEAGKTYAGFQTGRGENADTVVRKLPLLVTAAKVTGEKALAVVLARTTNPDAETDENGAMALMAWQRVGQGRVLEIVGDGLWRWAMLPPELEKDAGIFPEFWAQTVRWLASSSDFLPGQTLSIVTDRTDYAPNDPVSLTATLRGNPPVASPTLNIRDEAGRAQSLNLTPSPARNGVLTYTARFQSAASADYAATLSTNQNGKPQIATALFRVLPPIQEKTGQSANPSLMRQIAASGGGEALQIADLPHLPAKLRTLERASQFHQQARSLWDNPLALLLILSLLSLEWFLRRKNP